MPHAIIVRSRRRALVETVHSSLLLSCALGQDDSYAVNSESMGPWGDAIMYELLPCLLQSTMIMIIISK